MEAPVASSRIMNRPWTETPSPFPHAEILTGDLNASTREDSVALSEFNVKNAFLAISGTEGSAQVSHEDIRVRTILRRAGWTGCCSVGGVSCYP
ncbi:hypothetical protein BDW71DRAFT_189331 [Aspergillus fruticulosus]